MSNSVDDPTGGVGGGHLPDHGGGEEQSDSGGGGHRIRAGNNYDCEDAVDATDAAESASMTVIQKFNELNESIQDTRSDISHKAKAIEELKRNIESIRTHRERILDETVKAETDYDDLLKLLESATLDEMISAEGKYLTAANRHVEANRQVKAARQLSLDAQLKFLHDCSTFRTKIQRLALHGDALGLGQSVPSLLAYSLVAVTTKDDGGNEEGIDEGSGNTDGIYHHRSQILQLFESRIKTLLSVRSDKPDDDEFNAIAIKLKEQTDHNMTIKRRLQSLIKEKSSMEKSRDDRTMRKDELKAQIQRLQHAINHLKNEIGQIEQKSQERQPRSYTVPFTATGGTQNNTIIHNPYASIPKAASNRSRQNLVSANKVPKDITPPKWSIGPGPTENGQDNTGDRRVNNETTSSSTTKRRRSSSSSSKTKQRGSYSNSSRSRSQSAQEPMFVSGRLMPSSMSTDPFPHRTGRVRNSNRFGTSSLRISSGFGMNDGGVESYHSHPISSDFHRNHTEKNDSQIREDDSSEDELNSVNTKIGESTRHTSTDTNQHVSHPQSEQKGRLIVSSDLLSGTDDEESDDDDESLSFDPVFKKPMA